MLGLRGGRQEHLGLHLPLEGRGIRGRDRLVEEGLDGGEDGGVAGRTHKALRTDADGERRSFMD